MSEKTLEYWVNLHLESTGASKEDLVIVHRDNEHLKGNLEYNGIQVVRDYQAPSGTLYVGYKSDLLWT